MGLCKDYVTEKLFNAMQYDIIPIVFGSANYTAILPPNSYIDALQFPTVPTLVDHLMEVSSNEILYKSYFQWKNNFCVNSIHYLCSLCKHLNENALQTGVITTNRDIIKWWVRDAKCKTIKSKTNNWFTNKL
ncbi:unnamed protein product [Medioppia subpectinata]|uniref:Fucosyltransferase n=1 Tax=Medioppia subpectinata TaxID=1979941 RepID=A0A7R9KMT8_9ACAR|nr:unnamed protein product [Medioppia subpectinata]CAG2106166.1 unnamed protein product [Medioppia subpectinata]